MRAACGLDRPSRGPLCQARPVAARQVPGWLLGDEEGLVWCHVSLVKHCLGLLLAVPRQQVSPGGVAEGASQEPCGDFAATEGERVVEGATAERQVRGAVDPAHPQERGVLNLSSRLCRTAPNPSHTAKTLSADPCVSWCECVALIRQLVKLQEACDAKANHKGHGVMNAMVVVEMKNGPRKPYPSHLAWMTAVRDQVAVVETDNMADLVLSQGGTTIANLVRYQHKVGNLGRHYSSPLGAQRSSNLVRAHVLRYRCRHGERHDESRGAGRAQDGPHLLAAVTRFSSWSDYADHTTAIRGLLQGFLGAKTKAVILGVAHGGAVPDTEHAESARWLRALSVESRLLRWIACSDFGLLHDRLIEAKKPWPENPTFA